METNEIVQLLRDGGVIRYMSDGRWSTPWIYPHRGSSIRHFVDRQQVKQLRAAKCVKKDGEEFVYCTPEEYDAIEAREREERAARERSELAVRDAANVAELAEAFGIFNVPGETRERVAKVLRDIVSRSL